MTDSVHLGLRVTLLGFQRESLNWMTKQEHDPKAKGGILAGTSLSFPFFLCF